MNFSYASRGDGQIPAKILPAADQRRALGLALDALEPSTLAVPHRVADLLPPSPPGMDGSEMWLASAAGPAFDPMTLAGSLATEVLGNLFHRERAARLVIFHARDSSNPSLHEVLDSVMERTWGTEPAADSHINALQRVVQRSVLTTLMDLGGDTRAIPEVRALVDFHLTQLGIRIQNHTGESVEDRAHREAAIRDIERYIAGEDDPRNRSRFPVIPLPWP